MIANSLDCTDHCSPFKTFRALHKNSRNLSINPNYQIQPIYNSVNLWLTIANNDFLNGCKLSHLGSSGDLHNDGVRLHWPLFPIYNIHGLTNEFPLVVIGHILNL